jgi:putative ABC transport system substrate-binding protein
MVKKILLLNSYTLTSRRAEDQVRIRSFFDGLELAGYRPGFNVNVQIVDSNSLSELETETRKATQTGLDLIHAVGTPNAIVAAESGNGVPVVYYGAHPERAGEAALRMAGVSGMVLTLPFTQNYKSFRFIRKIFPRLKRLWVPFYEGTVFCRPEMKTIHRNHRRAGKSPWISGTEPQIGYRSLANLCYIIGLEYREFVYRDCEDLLWGLDHLESADDGDVLMPYNDSVYCEGAPDTLGTFSIDRNIPLFWNNNTEATQIGAVAAISGCFREAGIETGKIAAAILNGANPRSIGLLTSTKTYSSLNLVRAHALGLEPSAEVLSQFDEVITSEMFNIASSGGSV